MSFSRPEPEATAPQPVPSRRGRLLLPVLAVLGALLVVLGVFTSYYTDLLWFQSVGFSSVFSRQLVTKVALFAVFAALLGGGVGAAMLLAYRARPVYRSLSPEDQNLERYRMGLEPLRRWIGIGVPAAVGLLGGTSAAAEWQTFLLWRYGQPFGTRDPQFGIDLSFFLFSYSWWRFLLAFGFGLVILATLANLATHYLYGGLRLQASPGQRTTGAARVQLSVLLGLFVLLKAVAYWLDRYGLAVQDGTLTGKFTGLTYTDVNALLPAKTILAAIALLCATLFFVNVFLSGWRLPGLGFGLLVLSALLIGGVYPWVVQYFQVRPSEADREAPYIQRNINDTRAAYGLSGVKVQEYAAAESPEGAQPGTPADLSTIPNVRLLDPVVVAKTVKQLQQIRGYYGFPDVLDVDRYTIGGQERDVVMAVRELDLTGLPPDQRNWINDRTVYTHGYGFVAALGNTRDANGRPTFVSSDIPPKGDLGTFESRIYFGEQSPTYSIVGAPPGSPPRELDYPDDRSPNGQQNTTYTGKGGVPMGSLFRRMLFATKYQEANILLSNRINADSRILYDRTPRQRVQKVAPWLTLDGDPYPAVVSGRIVWIVDGYTTSNSYPYATRTQLGEATADTLAGRTTAVAAQPQAPVNYIRNSVKATVDAYDGTVTLYAWDEKDPVLQSWMRAFPGTVQPRSAISPQLMAHLRYPEDLFKVQRQLLTRYHVTDPLAFYGGGDYWRIPADPRLGDTRQEQPPYYLTVSMPGEQQPRFSLTTTFVPNNRPNLAAFMSVDAQPGPDYGTIRVLQLPRNTGVPGPGQVQNQFKSDTTIASQVNLLTRGGASKVEYGNLLTLPYGGGLLYVEPVYVSGEGGESYPLLQKVLVAFGNKVAFEDTLQQALASVFGQPVQPPSGTPTRPPPTTPPPAGGNADLAKALADAQQALADAQAALRAGDFAAYGAAQQRLKDAIDRAIRAEGASGTPTPTPSPTPTRSP